jgi:outer membrane protein OmpA-like peptidoglycan-associated protein
MGQTIGSEINTSTDDRYIFLHADDKTMYFASKGHNSIGGFDIFKSERLAGRWSTPENIGYPINTPYDETSFVMSASGKHAYVTSNRDGGKGGFDIYKVTYLGPVKPTVPDIQDQLLADIAAPQKDNKIEEAVKVESKNLTILKGRVLDDFSGKPIQAEIELVDNQKNEVVQSVKSNSSSGKFLVSLPAGKNYGIAVKAPEYLFHSENFDLPLTSDYQLVDKDIRLKNVCIGCKIILKNIFFDSGKFIIRPESTNELTRLASLIKDISRVKPGIKIEISGHTDNVGSETSNQQLSENRAKAVVKYLVDHGISQSFLTFKGYGSKEPVSSNSSPEGRQENRRTEFKILED